MLVLPPKRRCHKPWLMTMTSLDPPAVSAGVKVRPIIAGVRVTSKRFGVAEPRAHQLGLLSTGEARVEFLVAGDVDEALRFTRIGEHLDQRQVRRFRPVRPPDDGQPIGIAVRQRAQQRRLDEAEHRRVGADAERQRDDGDERRIRGRGSGGQTRGGCPAKGGPCPPLMLETSPKVGFTSNVKGKQVHFSGAAGEACQWTTRHWPLLST